MLRGFYCRLAWDNLRKNGRVYVPYGITVIVSVAMYYIVQSLAFNPGFEEILGFRTMNQILNFCSWVVRIFVVLFLLYSNSFLIKRRKKEFGVYHVLGMEKKHLSITLILESLIILGIGLGAGLILGMILDKLMFAVLVRMLGFSVPLGFHISGKAIGYTILLFGVVTLINDGYNVAQIHVATPIELLHGSDVGEKEPKAKWFLALLGCVALVSGYYLSLHSENPIKSLEMFFTAVLLVIAGTYLLFTAGSIVLLKVLRKNKAYYYKTKHFVGVSAMLYRMKQNAIGLAHICILSTMVLVMVSATASMMIGMEDILRERYPHHIMCYGAGMQDETEEELIKDIKNQVKKKGYTITQDMYFSGLALSAMKKGEELVPDVKWHFTGTSTSVDLYVMSLEIYNQCMGRSVTLADDEVLIQTSGKETYQEKNLRFMGKRYRVKESSTKVPENGIASANISDTFYVILPSEEIYNQTRVALLEKYQDVTEGMDTISQYVYGFDIQGNKKQQEEAYKLVQDCVKAGGYMQMVECREAERAAVLSIYGGLFFTGAFLALLFLMATVLIIYYKQIAEGYDDQKRFTIMQQVGMTKQEVSATIRSQVLTVFFLPLLAAGVHLCFAFPILNRLLKLLNMVNTKLYVACAVGCFLIFALFYVVIYAGTAKAYNRIVQK